ncbi:MAG TPA: c-type cytochrome [Polyangia bacterium]|nr:c-type cytochrome [Polyangia bacterium]
MKTTAALGLCLFAGFAATSGCLPQQGIGGDPGGTGGAGGDRFPFGTGGATGCSDQFGGASGGVAFPPGPMGAGAPFGATPPQFGATITREVAPPAISGGTLLMLHDGHTAFAADPDRDRLSVVDLVARTVKVTVPLMNGDEPGRAVEDKAGRVHVALRRGGAVVTLLPPAWTVSDRQAVCTAPRGLAYDAKLDRVHVACAGGELISLPAAGGPPARTVMLDSDLRDVVVDGDHLLVSRFRSAQILTVDASGAVTQRLTPPTFRSFEAHNNQLFSPSVAWRMTAMPDGGVAVVHQRGLVDEVAPSAGGYGSINPCDAIVQTAVLVMKSGQMPRSVPAIPGMVLPVDLAVSPDGKRVAVIAAGNATNTTTAGGAPALPRVFAADVADISNPVIGCRLDGTYGPCQDFGGKAGFPTPMSNGAGGAVGGTGGVSGVGGMAGFMGGTDPSIPAPGPGLCPTNSGSHVGELPEVVGEPTAVAYDSDGKVVVQTREPATLQTGTGAPIVLSTDSREDTGHTIFHSNAGASVACASCHAEGAEDGRTWNFACEGERRTQSLSAGISGTEPFHWNGDMTTFPQLIDNVFVARMSGPKLVPEQITAALRWIDHQPRVTLRAAGDAASIERGRALFNDKVVACATCHTGDKFTNNKTVDVGTKGLFQVPSLLGIDQRAPYMHDGCAPTLTDRFGACGGGDKHGVTSQLGKAQIADLVAYLQTL